MRNYLRILNNWGTQQTNSEDLNKRIYLSNQLAVILIIPFFFFLFSTLVFDLYNHFIFLSFTLLSFIAVPLLNRKGFSNISRVLLCLGPTVMITTAAIVTKTYGNESNIMVALAPRAFILCMAVLPLVIFNYQHVKLMWGIFIINSICVLFYDELHFIFGIEISQMEYSIWKYEWLRATISIAFITITLFLFVLQDINEKFQRKIEIQRKELIELNKLKARLLGVVSHDLKGPVSSLQSILTLLSMKSLSTEQLSEIAPRLSKKISSTVDTMDNLLRWAMSQMNGLQMNMSLLSLNLLTQDIIKLLEPNASKKGIVILNDIDIKSKVWADEEMLKIIIRNLLTNAIKFSSEKSIVTISLSDVSEEKIEVLVIDKGIGMDKEEIKNLFHIHSHFTKLGTQNEKGSGLGLLLCKELVEKQGGELKVDSTKGEGSIFSFTLNKSLNQKTQEADYLIA